MKCSYCKEKIRKDANIGTDFLIMSMLEKDMYGKPVKSKTGLYRNKVACRKCIGRIIRKEMEM